jgi:hypothetical protein
MAARKRKQQHETPLSKSEQQAISIAAVKEGKSYGALGRLYGRSRERIRQIVQKLNPGFKKAGVVKHGWCVRCGRPKSKPLAEDRKNRKYFGNENDFCSRCRSALYRQPVELTCQKCGGIKKVSIRWVIDRLQAIKRDRQRSFLRIAPGELKGTHVCQKCFYKLFGHLDFLQRRDMSPRVTTRCIGCGKERETRLATVISRRRRYDPKNHLVLVRCRDCFLDRNKEVDISLLTEGAQRRPRG